MFSFPKKYTNLIVAAATILATAVIAYFLVTTVFRWLLPFILAYLIAYITNPVVNFLQKKCKIPRKISSGITILITLMIIGSLITLVVYRIVKEFQDFVKQLPDLTTYVYSHLENLINNGVGTYLDLPAGVSDFIDNALLNLKTTLTTQLPEMLKPLARPTINFAKALPSVLVFIIVLLISTYFISSDRDRINKFIFKQLPDSWVIQIRKIKDDLILALLGYIRAQLILMSITFVEVTIGLLMIRVSYALLFAVIISFVDALPILGTGTILIPWAIFSLITGKTSMGLSLVILYGIILLVRQLCEPKILGSQIGLYPLVTLMSMYVGLQIFGVPGMIAGPITVLILKNLQRAGLLKLWKD